MQPATEGEEEFSLVRGDLLFRAQRAIGLIPATGLGLARRAAALALFTWLPIAVWALLHGRALPSAAGEPLFQHFGVNVRCLVAIPLLVLAEGPAHAILPRLVPYFLESGLVAEADRTRFREIVRGVARLRDATLPWIAMAGVLAAWTLLGPSVAGTHEVVWAQEGGVEPHLGFGGAWFLFAVRPIFLALLLGWLWRVALVFVLLARLARLELSIVPTHPDRAGGLGFLESLPSAFSLVAFAISAVVASHWAHDVVYHEAAIDSLKLPAAALLLLLLLLFLGPLLAFARPLGAARRRARLDYGALVGRHGRLVRRRWILREPVPDDALLAAPEIGPVADTLALYEAATRMRGLPLGRRALTSIALPVAIPVLIVVALRVPVKDILLKLVKTLL